jgi:hypothetical protein
MSLSPPPAPPYNVWQDETSFGGAWELADAVAIACTVAGSLVFETGTQAARIVSVIDANGSTVALIGPGALIE